MLLDQLTDFLHEGVQAQVLFVHGGRAPHQGGESAVVILNPHGGRALASFDNNLYLSVLLALRLHDPRNCTDPVDLLGCWFVDGSIVLSGEKNRPI